LGDDDDLNSALKTPLAAEDRNPTLIARGRDYDEGESSYGYGRLNASMSTMNGVHMSAMTEDIRQALSRSRFESPNPSFAALPGTRSRASSTAGSVRGSRANSSRRSSNAGGAEDLLSLKGLNIGTPEWSGSLEDVRCNLNGGEQGMSPTFDPTELVTIRRLGEGTGGAVEMVQDPRTGKIMAKKVSPWVMFQRQTGIMLNQRLR
jgi:mitogen-activated protein kinase kinase